ncbi:hypothetical protein SOVF_105190 [Spinacia oleracea]|nr:hypothetical protein SOVF_105190 [Spinacia oleracea]
MNNTSNKAEEEAAKEHPACAKKRNNQAAEPSLSKEAASLHRNSKTNSPSPQSNTLQKPEARRSRGKHQKSNIAHSKQTPAALNYRDYRVQKVSSFSFSKILI